MSRSLIRRLIVQLPPGSDEAIRKGCCCSIVDNMHGRGVSGEDDRTFWVNDGCPLHGEVINDRKETN